MPSASVFSANEIVEMAVQTEECGYAFYTAAAKTVTGPATRELLDWLAGQELLHKQTFEGLLGEDKPRRPTEEYAGQKAEYVQTLLDTRVLPDVEAGKAALADMTDDRQVIDFALGFEKDTILFMYEMRELLPTTHTPVVERLIAEEKSHVKRLRELRATRA